MKRRVVRSRGLRRERGDGDSGIHEGNYEGKRER